MNTVKSNLGRWIVFLVMPFVLSWPAWFNGQAFFFPDTTAYIKGAASAVDLFVKTDQARDWLQANSGHPPKRSESSADAGQTIDEHASSPDKAGVISGRSIYYGTFLFAIATFIGLKWVPLVQASLCVVLISTLLRASFSISYNLIALVLAFLAVLSPLPFFASMLMPDVFAGLGLTAMVGFLLLPNAPLSSRNFWAVLMAFATLFHTANIIILSMTLLALIVLCASFGQKKLLVKAKVISVFVLIGVGVLGEIAFGYAINRVTHTPPIRPPFLTARLVADGPGSVFIRERCSDQQFEVCKYPIDFTKNSSDEFLWSTVPGVGVFTLASKEIRLKLGKEDLPFARAVFFSYPGEVALNSLKNIALQLKSVGLNEFVYPPDLLQIYLKKIPPADADVLVRTKAALGEFDLANSELAIKVAAICSVLVCLAGMLLCYRRRQYRAALIILILLTGLLFNACVCGSLSTPHDRYQARLLWIVEMLAFILCLKGIELPKNSPRDDRHLSYNSKK